MDIIKYWLLVSISRVNSFNKTMSIFCNSNKKGKKGEHVYSFPEAELCSHFQQLIVDIMPMNKWIHDDSPPRRIILVERAFCYMVLGKKKPGLSSSRLWKTLLIWHLGMWEITGSAVTIENLKNKPAETPEWLGSPEEHSRWSSFAFKLQIPIEQNEL